MGLLHSPDLGEGVGALWELVDLAEEVGIPLPPPITEAIQKLPPLIDGVSSGDFGPALELLGPAAGPLGEVLRSPAVQSLIRGDLEGMKAGLLDYLGQLDGMKNDLFRQLMEAAGMTGALGQAQELLGGVRGALAQAGGPLADLLGGPLTPAVLDMVRQASPELGLLLGYAETALSSLDGQLSGAENVMVSLSQQLADLTNLRTLAERGLAELDGHLSGLDSLFEAIGGL